MKTRRSQRTWPVLCLASAMVVALCGCGSEVSREDASDRVEPMMRRAASRERARDLDGAIEIYEQVVRETPTVALAHLKLAILLDDYSKDYISAIYHYKEYLRRREGTEKDTMIRERLDRTEKKLEAQFSMRPGGSSDAEAALRGRIAELTQATERLKRENLVLTDKSSELEAEVERLRRRLRMAENTSVVRVDDGGSRLRQMSSEEQVVRTYKVVRGDSLTSISRKVYGDSSHWKKIYEANKETIADPSRLDLDQVLVIP